MSWMSYAIFAAPGEASGAGLISFIVVGNGVTIILYRLRIKTLGKAAGGSNEGHKENSKAATQAGFPLGQQVAAFRGAIACDAGHHTGVCRDRVA